MNEQLIGSSYGAKLSSEYHALRPAQQEAARAAEIPHELERLERTLKGCEQGLATLAGRLESSVMRSEPPSPVGNAAMGGPTAVPQTPYGSRIQELVSFAAVLNDRIQSINARLEV